MKTETTRKAQHTPGPWKTQRAHSGRIVYKETQRNFETNETRILAFLVRNEAQFPVEDSDANGHLIAAAPDLLAFAERVASWHGDEQGMSACVWAELIRQACVFVAEAKGSK